MKEGEKTEITAVLLLKRKHRPLKGQLTAEVRNIMSDRGYDEVKISCCEKRPTSPVATATYFKLDSNRNPMEVKL